MTEIPWMDKMWQEIFEDVVCLTVVLGSIAAAGYSLITGRASEQGIDGLFLIIVCLVFVALFSIIPAMSLRSGALAQLLKRGKPDAAAKGEAPAAEKSQGNK